MFAHIEGKISSKKPPLVVIDCNGVGYELHVPMSTFYELPEVNHSTKLLTHLTVREDAHILYGFLRWDERDAFRLLNKVSGIGARTALSILSGISTTDLQEIIVNQDAQRLIKVPGIGKKTAERLIVELKDAFGGLITQKQHTTSETANDVSEALVALGYSEKEIRNVITKLPRDLSVNESIKEALKILA